MPTEPELLRLFDRSPIGMYRSDASGRLLVVNPALVAILGYDTVEEVLALDMQKDVYANVNERAPVLESYRATGFVEGRRVHWKTRTGRILTVQIFGHVVETKDGLVFDATVIDMTEIDVLEEELRRRREILEQSMRQMPAVYWTTDRNMVLTEVGGPTELLFGFPPDRFIGRTIQDALEIPYRSDGHPVDNHKRALSGEIVQRESEYAGKLVASATAPFRNAAGEIIGVIGTLVDVTAHRTLERRMLEAQRAESLGVLAGGLAHDFNNLLVAVLGNADLALREIPAGKPGRTAIENIRVAGLRAAELTDQLLAYAGRGGAGTTRIELMPLVEEMLRISAPQFADVRVSVDVPTKVAVRGDPAQMRQVVMNLLSNAREAMAGRGEICLSAEQMQTTGEPDADDILTPTAGSYVAVRVVDNGPGMDRETRRHIFEPFFTTKQGGHGLGLAAVLGIVRAHGGGIRVSSSPGAGVTITVLWPAAVTAPTMRAVTGPVAAAPTVLVIDDEALVRDVVARMVEDLGYSALTAADGQSGLALLDKETVDAVLVDMTMPVMSGADVVAAVRTKRPGLPVVICSGYDRDGRGPVQADAYLPKPFRLDALQRTLAKLLPLRNV
ncbi:MAG TPA: ATP-binding protein [Kofleriaceae bacterium]|nr:ATP-binding protein [Kofleriaceae bacterium]